MNLKTFPKQFAVQFVGQGLLLGVAWYWLSLGVGTTPQVALNGLLIVAMLAGWSLLDAYGLGNWHNWLRVMPAVALTPLIGYHLALLLLIPLLWLLVLFPSAAIGRWTLLAGPRYLLICLGLLVAMSVIPIALLNWVPRLDGLNSQLGSFGGRTLLAFTVATGAWAALLAYIGGRARESGPVT